MVVMVVIRGKTPRKAVSRRGRVVMVCLDELDEEVRRVVIREGIVQRRVMCVQTVAEESLVVQRR